MAYPQPPQPRPGPAQPPASHPQPGAAPVASGHDPATVPLRASQLSGRPQTAMPIAPAIAPKRSQPPQYAVPIPDKVGHKKSGTMKAAQILLWLLVGICLVNAALPSLLLGEFTPRISAIVAASGAVLLAAGTYCVVAKRMNALRLATVGLLAVLMAASIVGFILGMAEGTLSFLEALAIFGQLGLMATTAGALLSSGAVRWTNPGKDPRRSRKPFPANPGQPSPSMPPTAQRSGQQPAPPARTMVPTQQQLPPGSTHPAMGHRPMSAPAGNPQPPQAAPHQAPWVPK
ncbi:hypothetical protein [Natronoglycomyces albus]|uniref:Uncharacterized protein n=1 Tax=Natronoglycomyces albus TaxID=2811108 RepID=A0A895XP01_9ACTN|nr:hypothetical protein [Natronoglycomyces albus]QSB04020.1 hypothetical protein JQS30_09305 [Natronoglycomyces albus]